MKLTENKNIQHQSHAALPVRIFLACALCFVFVNGAVAAQQGSHASAGALTLALPASGEVQVENLRGSIEVEVWDETYLTVAAVNEAKPAPQRRSPVQIEKTDNLLSIRVAREVGATTRVNLRLHVPAQAHLKLVTAEGELVISGVPTKLSAQTISGDVRVSLPVSPDAELTAQSLNGTVTLGVGLETADSSVGRIVRGKFRTRWGAGARSVNIFSGRGRITLDALQTTAAATAAAGHNDVGETTSQTAPPAATGDAASVRPSLMARPSTYATPQPAETPQEVDEDEVVRVESDLVTLNVSVVERASGHGLVGLKGEDFKLYEDDAEQQIAHFEASSAPFDLLLLMDLSGSTAAKKVSDLIRASALRFIAAARPQDRIAIVTFAGSTNLVAPLTTDRQILRDAINGMQPPYGDTKLYDALAYATNYLDKNDQSTRRRAVILMSDGLDSTLPNVTGAGSNISYDELRSRVQEFDGVLYCIWTSTEYEAFSPQDIQPETFDLAHDRMQELAEAGGGVFYDVEKLEDLSGAYERVIADLGTVYSLSYRPTNKQRDGHWRAIHVRLPQRPNAVARGKRGYFAK